MVKKIYFYLSILFLIPFNIVGQACDVKDSSDWEKVKILIMCPSEVLEKYHIIGEAEIGINKRIKKVDDLNFAQKKKIKTMAAESKSCLAFICYDKAFDKNSLYYCWVEDTVHTKIINMIYNLTEVKKLSQQIDSLSHNKRHITIFISSEPTDTEKYYWVKVAENNGSNLVSYYNFFIFPPDFYIKYFDTINDQIISLEDWRKKRKE